MSGFKLDQLCLGDPRLDEAPMLDRRDRVLAATDDQRRYLDRPQLITVIGVAHGRAVGGVSGGRRTGDHLGDAIDLHRMLSCEAGREPACNRAVTHVAHGLFTTAQHSIDTLVPDIVGADLRSGVADHQPRQPLTSIDAQPLTDQPAHGQAAEGETIDRQGIDQIEHVPPELLDAVRAGRDGRTAVPAGVIAQDAEMLAEGRHLRVPHIERGAQRVGQHQNRRIDRAIETVMQFAIGECDAGHWNLLNKIE